MTNKLDWATDTEIENIQTELNKWSDNELLSELKSLEYLWRLTSEKKLRKNRIGTLTIKLTREELLKRGYRTDWVVPASELYKDNGTGYLVCLPDKTAYGKGYFIILKEK